MPKVQAYDPGQIKEKISSVGPQRGVQTKFAAQATPDDFGAGTGRALQQFGGAIGDVSDTVVRGILDYKASKATTTNKLTDATIKANSHFEKLKLEKGEASTKLEAAYIAEHENIHREFLGQISDSKEKELFETSFNSLKIRNSEEAARRQGANIIAYEKEALSAANQTVLDEAVNNSNSIEHVQNAETTIAHNIMEFNRGRSKEIVDKAVADNVHNLYSTIIETKAQSSPIEALAYLENVKDKLNPVAREVLKAKLKDSADLEFVTTEADRISNSGLPIEKQVLEAEKIKNPKWAKQVEKEVIDNYERKEKFKEIQHTKYFESLADKVVENPRMNIPYTTITHDEYNKLKSLQKSTLDTVAGKGVTTDPALYNKLSLMSPDELAKEDLVQYTKDSLSLVDFKYFTKLKTDPGKQKELQTLTNYVNGFTKMEADKDFDKAAFMREEFSRILNSYPKDQQGRIETWNKVKDQMLLDMDVEGYWNKKYYEAKMEGAKIIKPAKTPKGIPEGAEWVDYTSEGKNIRGWSHTDENNNKVIYVPEGGNKVGIYRFKK